MSKAGIQSNRGDTYQKLVAFEWALALLVNDEYLWLETDSVNHFVDDVVVAKVDGSLHCCQCKKNEPKHRPWTVNSLQVELDKAARELARNSKTDVRFYSGSTFGELAALKEFTRSFSNQEEYQANLTSEHSKTNVRLEQVIADASANITTFDFLSRTRFVVKDDFESMERRLRELLSSHATNSEAAFDAIWRRLDNLGARVSSRTSKEVEHRLTRDELENVIRDAGSMLAPPMAVQEIRRTFEATSSIGRSWMREIGGVRIDRSEVDELVAAVDSGWKSILVTGDPGSGKTCVMLDLQEALEERARTVGDLVPLFIQTREFVNASSKEREAVGLASDWVAKCARLAEHTKVVVVIDSLDVLSIARDHKVLSYFLAQIDQLFLIPRVTVITACRDFDRRYDRRIAGRNWGKGVRCGPLDWGVQVRPLLEGLNIDVGTLDDTTRRLLENPRDLAMFVELATRDGSFNEVTSQALAQHYLRRLVLDDPRLGTSAMEALETMATEMLKARTLEIPRLRFQGTDEALRVLLSENILATQSQEMLTFGHQTLLDVLVISGAVRADYTLNQFIQTLPPVPFVRPAIRGFVQQLASSDRKTYRKQIRAVLDSDSAFHIRRLVAETFAGQPPAYDDWPLLRHLRDNHRGLFQAVYKHGHHLEWHNFWLEHLVPSLLGTADTDGLLAHVTHIIQWSNEDPEGIIAFWQEMLSNPTMNQPRLPLLVSYGLANITDENLTLAPDLIHVLIAMPGARNTNLGATIARAAAIGVIDDDALWRYATALVTDGDLKRYRLNGKLDCLLNDFGTKSHRFIITRMVQSIPLLNLAIATIEEWSETVSSERRFWTEGFLDETSHADKRTESDSRPVSGLRILMEAVQAAIVFHATEDSDWWQDNRERLAFSHEASLRYFAILGLTRVPETNTEVIAALLTESELLDSGLSFELRLLIEAAYIHLEPAAQDLITEAINQIGSGDQHAGLPDPWVARKRAKYISSIPCFLRSPRDQAFLLDYQKIHGVIERRPAITRGGGVVTAPFSHSVFLNADNGAVVGLLKHYHDECLSDGLLVGGQHEVGIELMEASSRDPLRFLQLLANQWNELPSRFKADIMAGVARHLSFLHGNLQKGGWEPTEMPNPQELATRILEELEQHQLHWQGTGKMADALEACAHVVQDPHIAERMTFLAIGFRASDQQAAEFTDPRELLSAGWRAKAGKIGEGLVVLANSLLEQGVVLPELLVGTLINFAGHENQAVRALILRSLPYFQSKDLGLGWELFERATRDSAGLWQAAETCLYYAYYRDFDRVAPHLQRIVHEGNDDDFETWGRISALCVLSGHIQLDELLSQLNSHNRLKAWEGAATVWTHPENVQSHPEACISGIVAGLSGANDVAQETVKLLPRCLHQHPPLRLPYEVFHFYFAALENESESKADAFGVQEWLNETSLRDPEQALTVAEAYLDYELRTNNSLHDFQTNLVQLVNRLFGEAEEREESDGGVMLQRVINLQDNMLSLGLNTMDDWLRAAERP